MEYSRGSKTVGKSRMDSRKIRDPPKPRQAPAVRIESSTSLWGGPQRSSWPLTSPRFSFYSLRPSLILVCSPSLARPNSPFRFFPSPFLSIVPECRSQLREARRYHREASSASFGTLRRPPIFREWFPIPRNDDLHNSVSLRPSGQTTFPIPGLTRDPVDIQGPAPDRFHGLDFCILLYSLRECMVDKYEPDFEDEGFA